MEEKKVLEETLHREKLKWAATEQAMKDLEQQFADKERNWKVVEEELWGTISELQQQLRKQTCEENLLKLPQPKHFRGCCLPQKVNRNYYILVYTKTVDSIFRLLWLATQSVNILHYSLIQLKFLRASNAKLAQVVSKMPSRFAAETNKQISQLIKQAVPQIHEEGDEVRFGSFNR